MLLDKDKLLKEKNWRDYLKCFDLDQKVDGFMKMKEFLNDQEYYHYLGIVLKVMNCQWKYIDTIKKLVNARDDKNRYYMMNDTDKKLLKQLPDQVEIYRGCREINKEGFSWSLYEEIASSFMRIRTVPEWELGRMDWDLWKRYKKSKRILLRGLCKKEDIIAVFTALGEAEVFIDYNDVEILEVNKRENGYL